MSIATLGPTNDPNSLPLVCTEGRWSTKQKWGAALTALASAVTLAAGITFGQTHGYGSMDALPQVLCFLGSMGFALLIVASIFSKYDQRKHAQALTRQLQAESTELAYLRGLDENTYLQWGDYCFTYTEFDGQPHILALHKDHFDTKGKTCVTREALETTYHHEEIPVEDRKLYEVRKAEQLEIATKQFIQANRSELARFAKENQKNLEAPVNVKEFQEEFLLAWHEEFLATYPAGVIPEWSVDEQVAFTAVRDAKLQHATQQYVQETIEERRKNSDPKALLQKEVQAFQALWLAEREENIAKATRLFREHWGIKNDLSPEQCPEDVVDAFVQDHNPAQYGSAASLTAHNLSAGSHARDYQLEDGSSYMLVPPPADEPGLPTLRFSGDEVTAIIELQELAIDHLSGKEWMLFKDRGRWMGINQFGKLYRFSAEGVKQLSTYNKILDKADLYNLAEIPQSVRVTLEDAVAELTQLQQEVNPESRAFERSMLYTCEKNGVLYGISPAHSKIRQRYVRVDEVNPAHYTPQDYQEALLDAQSEARFSQLTEEERLEEEGIMYGLLTNRALAAAGQADNLLLTAIAEQEKALDQLTELSRARRRAKPVIDMMNRRVAMAQVEMEEAYRVLPLLKKAREDAGLLYQHLKAIHEDKIEEEMQKIDPVLALLNEKMKTWQDEYNLKGDVPELAEEKKELQKSIDAMGKKIQALREKRVSVASVLEDAEERYRLADAALAAAKRKAFAAEETWVQETKANERLIARAEQATTTQEIEAIEKEVAALPKIDLSEMPSNQAEVQLGLELETLMSSNFKEQFQIPRISSLNELQSEKERLSGEVRTLRATLDGHMRELQRTVQESKATKRRIQRISSAREARKIAREDRMAVYENHTSSASDKTKAEQAVRETERRLKALTGCNNPQDVATLLRSLKLQKLSKEEAIPLQQEKIDEVNGELRIAMAHLDTVTRRIEIHEGLTPFDPRLTALKSSLQNANAFLQARQSEKSYLRKGWESAKALKNSILRRPEIAPQDPAFNQLPENERVLLNVKRNRKEVLADLAATGDRVNLKEAYDNNQLNYAQEFANRNLKVANHLREEKKKRERPS